MQIFHITHIYIPYLIKKMDSCDVCFGSRYIKGGGIKNWGLIRKTISWSANTAARILVGSNANDNTGAFRCYKAKVIDYLLHHKISSNGYSFLLETSYMIQKKGFKIAETPIIFVDRRYGSSKISKKEIIKWAKTLFKLSLKRI
jgi:dolichol-phosphate mannosyltransferase